MPFSLRFSSEWGMELTGGLGYDGIKVLGISNRMSTPGLAFGLALLQRLPVVIPDLANRIDGIVGVELAARPCNRHTYSTGCG